MTDQQDSHYRFLGLDAAASTVEIAAAVERVMKRAKAVTSTDPERSYQIRERLRRVKEDLLSGSERRAAYDRSLVRPRLPSSGDYDPESSVTTTWMGKTTSPTAWEHPGSSFNQPLPPAPPTAAARRRHRTIGLSAAAVTGALVLGAAWAMMASAHWNGGDPVSTYTPTVPVPTTTSTPIPLTSTTTPVPTPTPSPPVPTSNGAEAQPCKAGEWPDISWSSASTDVSQVTAGGYFHIEFTVNYGSPGANCQARYVRLGATLFAGGPASQPYNDRSGDSPRGPITAGVNHVSRGFSTAGVPSGTYQVVASVDKPNWLHPYVGPCGLNGAYAEKSCEIGTITIQ
jgi:hypothetical protein